MSGYLKLRVSGLRISGLMFALAFLVGSIFFFENLCTIFSAERGYQCQIPSVLHLTICVVIAVIPVLFMPLKSQKPSAVILWIVYYAHVASTVMLYPYVSNVEDIWGWFWLISIVALFCLSIISMERIRFRINFPVVSFYKFYGAMAGLVIFCLLYIGLIFGWKLDAPSIADVYGLRKDFVEQLEISNSVFAGYVFIAGGFAVAPTALIFGYINRKRHRISGPILMGLAIFLSFLIYSSAGFKSVAFVSFLSLLVMLTLERFRQYGFLIAVGIPFVILVSFVIANFTTYDLVFDHWYRRTFMVPGMNVNYFFDYMRVADIRHLEYAPLIISEHYYGTSGSANAGLFGDGFAKASFLGMMLNSVIFVVLAVAFDSLAVESDPAVVAGLVVPSAYAISNSSMTSVFFTYGALLVLMALFFGSRSFRRGRNRKI